MSRDRGNEPEIVSSATWFSWDAYDRLPSLVRRALAFAPYDYGCGMLVEQLEAGNAPEGVARLFVRRVTWHVGREALRVYGAEHPQARA